MWFISCCLLIYRIHVYNPITPSSFWRKAQCFRQLRFFHNFSTKYGLNKFHEWILTLVFLVYIHFYLNTNTMLLRDLIFEKYWYRERLIEILLFSIDVYVWKFACSGKCSNRENQRKYTPNCLGQIFNYFFKRITIKTLSGLMKLIVTEKKFYNSCI